MSTALVSLFRRLWPGRLNESRDGGYGLGVGHFERKLFGEESDAVTGGFGVGHVRQPVFTDVELRRVRKAKLRAPVPAKSSSDS